MACAGLVCRSVLIDQLGCNDLEIILRLTKKERGRGGGGSECLLCFHTSVARFQTFLFCVGYPEGILSTSTLDEAPRLKGLILSFSFF